MLIEIIPFGGVDNFSLDYLKENLSNIFSAEVYLGQPQPLPEYAYNKNRDQYLSSEVLNNLSRIKNNNRHKILAVINKDLYASELNFVFGQADTQNGLCIISLERLHQSFYGLSEQRGLFLRRALKEAVHEIGHLFDLGHCHNCECVMYFSNSIFDTDTKDYRFCSRCKKLLEETIR